MHDLGFFYFGNLSKFCDTHFVLTKVKIQLYIKMFGDSLQKAVRMIIFPMYEQILKCTIFCGDCLFLLKLERNKVITLLLCPSKKCTAGQKKRKETPLFMSMQIIVEK